MTGLRKRIISAGAIAASLTAIVTAWTMLNGPIPAFSADIDRLDRQQAETAIDLYRKAIRDNIFLKRTAGNDPIIQGIIKQDLDEAREKLKRAQERKIELSQ